MGNKRSLITISSYAGLEIWENKCSLNDMVAYGYRLSSTAKTDTTSGPKASLSSVLKILHEYWASQYQNIL